MRLLVTMSLAVSLVSHSALAEGYPWRRIDGLSFSSGKAGLVINEGEDLQDKRGPYYYELDPSNWSLQSIDAATYESRYAPSQTKADPLAWGSTPFLRLSDGNVIGAEYGACEAAEEGGPFCKQQDVIYKEKRIRLDTSKQCSYGCNVVLTEKFGNQLWIGLGVRGELEWYGNGFQVYDLDSKKRLFTYSERVTGGLLPSIFKKDPTTASIWIATNQGLRIADEKLKLVKTFYFYEDFDPKTEVAELKFSSSKHDSNVFAQIARRLKVKEPKIFHSDVKSLGKPPGIAEFSSAPYRDSFFVPPPYNVLVPYFIRGTDSDDAGVRKFAVNGLCAFNDKRAIDFVLRQHLEPLKSAPNSKLDKRDLKYCLQKYGEKGLLPPEANYKEWKMYNQ